MIRCICQYLERQKDRTNDFPAGSIFSFYRDSFWRNVILLLSCSSYVTLKSTTVLFATIPQYYLAAHCPPHLRPFSGPPHSGACFLLVQWFSPWVLTVSFCLRTSQWEPSSIFHLPSVPYIYRSSACHLLARWFAEPISSTLKMEAICSSETSDETQRTTRRHIADDDALH
jgi:hypothetical protein